MKRQPRTQRGFNQYAGIPGERNSEIGRKLEKGQTTDPALLQKVKQQQVSSKDDQDWKLKLAQLEAKDKEEAEKGIKQVKQFLEEVAGEEKKRQQEMRQRVEEIIDKKLKSGKAEDAAAEGVGVLREPQSKPKRGSFMARLKKKGKGAMLEARGAIAKGGG